MLIDLRSSLFEQKNMVKLKIDFPDALKEWKDWKWFLDPNHSRIIEQIEQRKKDSNLILHVNVVEMS